MMKNLLFYTLTFLVMTVSANCQSTDKTVFLVIRGDDMGAAHAVNEAIMDSYLNGVMRTVELMPVTAWFTEAVAMLKENQDLDVGIHLALTSEWTNIKWRPLTHVPSLVDSNGNFYPMVWQQSHFPPNTSIQSSDWKIEEIEQELRAQIELALKHVPYISHMGGHMGFSGLDPRIGEVMKKLEKEYGLEIDMAGKKVQYMRAWNRDTPYEKRIDVFCEALEKLKPGYHIFVEHPAYDVAEIQGIHHPGYEDVAIDREWVTRVFTSEKVKKTIESKGIKLISYRDLK
jgi:chitin disaccharide deacetylase